MPLDLSVVITTFNSAATLGDTIESLLSLDITESPCEIIVVDNASFDNSAIIADGYSQVNLLRCPSNLGLARANNIGADIASGGSILFLNPDTVILPGALHILMKFQLNHPNAALLGPLMLDSGGTIQSTARTYPTLLDIVLRRTSLGKLPRAEKRLQKHLNPADTDKPSKVDWLVGAAMWLTPTGRERVGLMSEKYFLYFEDVQLCMRARERGMGVWFVPEAVIRHDGRRASAGGSTRALWLHLRSMVRFFSEYPCALIGKCSTDHKKD
ncbi:MAG: glycosyltransferase family 2 protein [Candidatus Aegiribacteria sp.]|nr:glycosyltransferase family 2 protein [Candidatus Aegiribacteria sp.]